MGEGGGGLKKLRVPYPMLHTNASGPKIWFPGQISAGPSSEKHQNRPSSRPKAGHKADVEASPTRIQPKSSPEAGFPDRKHYCVI